MSTKSVTHRHKRLSVLTVQRLGWSCHIIISVTPTILKELWLVMVYCSLRLKYIVLPFNCMIEFLENMTLETKKLCGLFSHITLRKDHYWNSHFRLLWDKLWKERLNFWSTIFLKSIFYPRLKPSFISWNFCDFRYAHQHVFFLSQAPCFKPPYLHYKRESIKILRYIFFPHSLISPI